MPNKWCVLFYWLLVCLDIPGEFPIMETEKETEVRKEIATTINMKCREVRSDRQSSQTSHTS